MLNFAMLIPLFPLLAFFILIAIPSKNKKSAATIGATSTGLSFLASVWALFEFFQTGPVLQQFTWYSIGSVDLTAGFQINQLNVLMLVIVSLVGTLIQIFSMGYMKGERLPVYYAYLGLFTASMMWLVMSPNLLQMYFFWELVGLGSFLLIGFYFQKESAKQAAKKAFIMTRIGDVGLLIGILLLFSQTKTFELARIFQVLETGSLSPNFITLVAILIFIGAVGKSAQFPLHTWLPDAMEGPTPVSALIHAATMVAAGVYLVATLYPLFLLSQTALAVIAVVGGVTTFLAATIALTQNDIKRVLAYSTVSQLGLMMLALGKLGYTAALFHLTTHAFFKALLFLAAGSVIFHAGTQNIAKMTGNLRKKLPITHATFLIGSLSISGLPLLSGFFSKDEILISIFSNGNQSYFWLALLTSFLTACYMFRMYFLIFIKTEENPQIERETAKSMQIPLVILAIFSVGIGYLHTHWFGTYLGDWLLEGKAFLNSTQSSSGTGWIVLVTAASSLAAIALTYFIYVKNFPNRNWFSSRAPFLYKLINRAYYFDELYNGVFVAGTKLISYIVKGVDRYILGGLVLIVTGSIALCNKILRGTQNGNTQTYGLVAIVGLLIFLAVSLWTGGYF